MKLQLQKRRQQFHCNAAMSYKTCNEAVAAETHSNGCIATAAMSYNCCNEAASGKVEMKPQLQNCTATVALQLQQ